MLDGAPISTAKVDKETLLIVLWAGVATAFGLLICRVCVRLRRFHKLFIDDHILFLAWLMALTNAAIWQARATQLYLGIELASGNAQVFPSDLPSQVVMYLRAILGAYLVQYTGLWSVKLSFLFFFQGLGRNIKLQRILWWFTLAFIIVPYAICIGTVDYHCLGSTFVRSTTICRSPSTARFEYVTLRLTTALDVLTDAAIIALSTNILWKIQINWRKKLALIGICSITVFVIAVAIARVVVATIDSSLDLTFLILWGGVELSVAIIVACLASFRALFTRSGKSPRVFKKFPRGDEENGKSDSIPLKNSQTQNSVTVSSEDSPRVPKKAFIRRGFSLRWTKVVDY